LRPADDRLTVTAAAGGWPPDRDGCGRRMTAWPSRSRRTL